MIHKIIWGFYILIIIGIIFIFIDISRCKNKKQSLENIKIHDENVYISESKTCGEYGRGVYAGRNIKEGEYFDSAEYIIDNTGDFRGILNDYTFNLIPIEREAYAFGNASLYNHSDKPSAKYFVDIKVNKIIFQSLRDIKKDEEITVFYGENWWKKRKKDFKQK